MDRATQTLVEKWLQEPFDLETRLQVQKLIDSDTKELEDSFYKDLTFGTGGLRGLMGVGTNRMNRYTVRRSTKGLGCYLKKEFGEKNLSVVIGFDNRILSKEFAEEAANVLIQSGINVFFLKSLRPTPYISFACRYFGANAAIMITASHNPKEYNGYKVYWQDGAQVVPPHDEGIIQEIIKINDFNLPESDTPGTLHLIGNELDFSYIDAIRDLQYFPNENKAFGHELKIVYTSLHGTGITMVPKALEDWGFSSISLVKDQVIPDGNFPTVKVPNPEYKEALQLGMDLLKTSLSDILLATDPDADRLGTAILHKGDTVILNGNEIASICAEYLCSLLSLKKALPLKTAIITTIVSTDLLKAICTAYDIECHLVLTGFKYIGEKIHLWEVGQFSPSFLFGAEESYGYLYGTHARDKDAIIMSCLLAEIALHCKKSGHTLVDFLHEIYRKYGIYRESLISIEFSPGKEGIDSIRNLMDKLRKKPPQTICEIKVLEITDYLEDALTQLPTSDVLLLKLEDESKLVLRPSGTEPKLKIYGGVRYLSFTNLEDGIKEADAKLEKFLNAFKQEILTP